MLPTDPDEEFSTDGEDTPIGANGPPGELDPADLDFDIEADDGEDDEEDGDEDMEDGEGGEAPAKPASKKKPKAEEDEEVAHPDTPVPTAKKMQSALEWAFESEEEVTPEIIASFTKHALLTLKANREMNLVTVFDPKELAAKLYLDSWRISRLVPLMARRIVDLGSGGGFPGIPVAIAEPMCSMTLCEANPKKAANLEAMVEALGLRNVKVQAIRAEDYLAGERCDAVLVRSVSSVRENIRTLRKVRHSLKDYVMIKGKSWSREVRAAEREAERLGFKLDTVWEHELPEEMGSCAVLVYRAPGGAGM